MIHLPTATIIKDATTNIDEDRKVRLREEIEEAQVILTAAHERYQILTRQVSSFAFSFRNAEVRFNAGASTQVDYLIAKNNLDRANTNLISARYDYFLRKKILDLYAGIRIF